MLGVAAPHVVDSVAERVADSSIDHCDLSVVALVVARELAKAHAVIHAEIDARRAQPRPRVRRRFLRAALIDEHTHFNPVLGARRQRLGHPLGDRAVMPEKRFQMNAVRRPSRVVEHGIEEAAVLHDRDAIALGDVAPHQRGE
jgi:hypothetical protein